MRKISLLPLLCIVFLLNGCAPSVNEKPQSQEYPLRIGNNISIDAPKQLTLLENNDTLAADGLYYATWTDCNSAPYENSDGETVDLYEAQLYFLASETPSEENAQKDCATWLSAAQEAYEVNAEETITCGGQSYTVISYNCTGDSTPYDRGVSAFGTCGVNAVCVEFTCLENYDKDLESILTEFLNGCHFAAD